MPLPLIVVLILVTSITLQGPANADPIDMPKVKLNRDIEMIPVKGGCFKMGDATGAGEENERHSERLVEIGIRPAKDWLIDHETVGGLMSPTDRAGPGNETHPISRKNENENCGKKPERPLDQARADNAFQKIVQTPDEPFQKILRSGGNTFHVPCRDPGKNDQPHGHDPADDHRIGDREAEGAGDLNCLLWQAVFLRFSDRRRQSALFGISIAGHVVYPRHGFRLCCCVPRKRQVGV